jgi:hypothetical protein
MQLSLLLLLCLVVNLQMQEFLLPYGNVMVLLLEISYCKWPDFTGALFPPIFIRSYSVVYTIHLHAHYIIITTIYTCVSIPEL